MLVAGGSNSSGTASNTSEIYNPTTGKWTATGNMPVSESTPATLLQSGSVLVAGGDNGELYNPSNGQWTKTGTLYYGDSGGASTVLLTNDVLLYGNHLPSYTAQYYNPAANTRSRSLGQTGIDINSGPQCCWPTETCSWLGA